MARRPHSGHEAKRKREASQATTKPQQKRRFLIGAKKKTFPALITEGVKHVIMKLNLNTSAWKLIFLLLVVATLLYIFVVSRDIDLVKEDKSLKTMEGLRIKGNNFTMEGKPFRILGGALHYFRVPHKYWEDRMVKMKAMGLNTLET